MAKANDSTSTPKREERGLRDRKKPYTKPTLRRLGTIRDLTQTGVSGNTK